MYYNLISDKRSKDSTFHPAGVNEAAYISHTVFFGSIFLIWYVGSAAEPTIYPRLNQRLSSHLPVTYGVLLAIPFLFLLYPKEIPPPILDSHPIDSLIQKANVIAETWTKQASASQTLEQALVEYRRRYKRYPPPGFDEWYNFATARSSLVIDAFDQIYDDLEPFWSLSPAEIRSRTSQMFSDPFNDVADIIIRSGKAQIGPKIRATHRWMLEGIVSMMKDFSNYLPDMDLAVNVNDEPRVAIPYKNPASKKKNLETIEYKTKLNYWSAFRRESWPDVSRPSRVSAST